MAISMKMSVTPENFARVFPGGQLMLNVIEKHAIVIRYIIAGGTAAVVDLGALYFFTAYVGFHYLTSVAIAFGIAFVVSFTLQKFWTFRDHLTHDMRKQSMIYFFVSLGNFFLNMYLMYLSVEKLHIYYLLAQVLVGGAIAVSSFLLYKYVIFAREHNTP